MCDTLCTLSAAGTVFAKNSDRPPDEPQLVAAHGRRPPGPSLATQYLTIPDAGAAAALLARPAWLWGAEHGVNEHGVAIGNERVYTTADPAAADALIGMDLVRLVLERATSADGAVEILGDLLAAHGQGGVGDTYGEAYDSSFLVADPRRAWVVDTAGSRWAARAVGGHGAVSNRLSVGAGWERGDPALLPGTDFDSFRDPGAPTGHADRRLAASSRFLAAHPPGELTPAAMVAHLRDHGTGPWGAVGTGGVVAVPDRVEPDFTGISVCMHVKGYMATTSSMVVLLPTDPAAPRRCWVAAGSPCVSLYVPAFPPQPACPDGAVPAVLGDPGGWSAGAAVRDRAEGDAAVLPAVRAVLGPLEAELWQEADDVAEHPDRWAAAAEGWSRRAADALRRTAGV